MSKKRSPIWEYFKVAEDSHYAIYNVTSCNENVSRGGQTSNLQELDTFLAEPLIKFGRESCYSWWASNHCRFPSLAKIARQYLSAPATSVASERLFSGAGDVYDEKRSRLTPENAEMLLFIKNNFDLRCH